MKKMFHNDQICGGVAAQEYVETLANEMDNAFAQGEFYQLGIDEIQVWFDFILVGEPECPQKIVVESNGFHHHRADIENPDGLSVWGMCLKAAESFLDLLVSEYNYNPVFNTDKTTAQESSTNQDNQEKQIYDYCFDYGYEWISAEAEYPDVEYKDEMVFSVLCEEPDDFFDEFGDDADWDDGAMYAGMATALKDFSGKSYEVNCDGYRVLAVSEDSATTIEAFSNHLNDNRHWENIKLF